MSKNTSSYLDVLRFIAALGVFLYHSANLMPFGVRWVFYGHGPECVAIFFVISGLVIRFTTLQKEKDWASYTAARISRILPVAVFAILATLVIDAVGLQINAAVYKQGSGDWFNPSTNLFDVASALTFTTDIWFRHIAVGSNGPYWSLSYEVSYYLLYGILIFARGHLRWGLALGGVAILGPRIIAYMPLWLMGVLTFDIISSPYKLKIPHRPAGLALFCISGLAYAYMKFVVFSPGEPGIFHMDSASQMLRSWLYFTLVGVATSANIIGFELMTRGRFQWDPRIAKVFAWLAGGSFSLYVMHQPLLVFARAIVGDGEKSRIVAGAASLGVVVVCYLFAECVERRKRFFRGLVDNFMGRLPAERRQAVSGA